MNNSQSSRKDCRSDRQSGQDRQKKEQRKAADTGKAGSS